MPAKKEPAAAPKKVPRATLPVRKSAIRAREYIKKELEKMPDDESSDGGSYKGGADESDDDDVSTLSSED